MGDGAAVIALLVLIALIALAIFADLIAYHRRSSFEPTIKRQLPAMRTLVHHRGLRAVAWRAVDVATPVAPRHLGDQELL